MAREHRLRIPAVIERVEEACEFVSNVARLSGMTDEAVHRCYLAIEEICTNIIEHGYHFEGDQESIDVICEQHPNHLAITIVDDSSPFNPLAQPDPDPAAPLADRKHGGWGIYFVKKYMDNINYRYDRKRNRLTIEKQF
jgi:anti-sigma regulatory factor (Ser/Thr protein kinase)